jgi:hypothetical protein
VEWIAGMAVVAGIFGAVVLLALKNAALAGTAV